MKQSYNFRLFIATAAAISLNTAFAADRVRNSTVTALVNEAAWDGGASGTPGSSDRAVWNSASVGGGTTLGGDASWAGVLISGATPSSGPSFTNALNASTFTLSLGGSGIDLNDGGITNRGVSFESNTKLDLAANQVWKLGNGQSSANIVASSVISGSASIEVTRTSGALNYAQFGGANTFTGGVNLGTNSWVRVGSSSITSGLAVVSGPTGIGNLTINDGARLTTISGSGMMVAAPLINLLGNATINQNVGANGRLQIAGTWDLGNAPRTLTIEKTSSSVASGNEGLGFATPTNFSSPKIQNGALTLSTFSGTSENKAIVRFTTTTFDNNAALIVDDGVVITSQNGSFFATGANSPSLTLNSPGTRGGGILQMGDGAVSGVATTRSATVYSLGGGGGVSASNTSGTASTGTLTVNNGNGATFSGNISQGGTGIIAFTKSGTGTQTLAGTNTYTGKTIINTSGGILKFAKQVSLYNNTPANWTDANIQVDSGTTLALNVGGTGEFTSSDIAILTALGTGSGGFKSNSRIGLDTTNASGASFTYSNVLANPNAGANALGLRKLGSGTLVLDQINTYSGGTIVEGGTLKIVQPGGIHTDSLLLNPGTGFEVDFSALVAAGQVSNTTTGSGTITATPPNASQLSFTSGTLTGFVGTINVKPSPANNGRVDFNGLIGSGSTLNIDSGATARLANSGIYSGLTVNVSGNGGSGPGALRMESGTLDSSCAVDLLANTSIGGFIVTSTIDAVISDGGNSYSLTKSGSSILDLTGNNTYTGDTVVTGGTLRISKPYLANSSAMVIGSTAILDLNFDETSSQVTDTVDTLTIGGVQQAPGVYGATDSGASTVNDTNFAGVGTLTVLNGPIGGDNFNTWATDNGIPAQAFDGDFDKDGISNGIEYALGMNPAQANGSPGQLSGNTINFTKGEDAIANGDVTWIIETSINLKEDSWTNEVTQAAGDPATTLSYVFNPGFPAKKFARLKVIQEP